jgi:phosphoribosylformimino-5-aminoimidazole carboxamide ribotide isomerase
MKIIPAIDLIDGKCVRLYQGNFNQTTVVGNDPETQLQNFIEDGAELVHIVDLDGARQGIPTQFELISSLCESSIIPVQVGGGIRSLETIERYLKAGVSRIVLGTTAIEDHTMLTEALKEFNEYIVIGIDAKNGKVATRGWETVLDIDYIEFAKRIENLGVMTIIYTDISKDGTMSGPNLIELKRLKEEIGCKVIASGGIRDKNDLESLSTIGITESIVGKAIYEGTIRL